MSVSTGLTAPVMHEAHDPRVQRRDMPPAPASDGCMFCSKEHGLRSSGADPLGFIEHLRASDQCRQEYELWKQVITDEWQGD